MAMKLIGSLTALYFSIWILMSIIALFYGIIKSSSQSPNPTDSKCDNKTSTQTSEHEQSNRTWPVYNQIAIMTIGMYCHHCIGKPAHLTFVH